MSENRYFGAVIAALAIAIVCACVPAGPKVRVINDGTEAVKVKFAHPLEVPKFDDSWVEVPSGDEVTLYGSLWWRNDRRPRLLVSKDGDVLSVYEVIPGNPDAYSLLSEPYFVVLPAPVRISPETSLAWHDLWITNNLTESVHIIRDNFHLRVVVEPESTKKLRNVIPLKPDGRVRPMGVDTFIYWKVGGELLYDATFTIDELEAMDWHLVMQ